MEDQEHISPDRLLRLLVTSPDGDVTIGFADCPAHTHASILAELLLCNEAAAVERFISDVVESRAVIAIWRIGNRIRDVWLPEHEGHTLHKVVADLRNYGEPDETVEFRLWNGTIIDPD